MYKYVCMNLVSMIKSLRAVELIIKLLTILQRIYRSLHVHLSFCTVYVCSYNLLLVHTYREILILPNHCLIHEKPFLSDLINIKVLCK